MGIHPPVYPSKSIVFKPKNSEHSEIFHPMKAAGKPALEMLCMAMMNPSELSRGERELIATYVSTLNNCPSGTQVHADNARQQGVRDEIVTNVIDGHLFVLSDRLLAMFAFAKQATKDANKISMEDVKTVSEAGWGYQAAFDTLFIVACLAFINRITCGCGSPHSSYEELEFRH
ncbi:carboxymuconolactone decarboxylase family protein [Flexibacterium corallicola]|uniref:carboxymuconolactone decarboxylase family protein n=1 Tax=Flexibacterium corallicola TaxID=3037259 RepID=UPI00286F79F7|nr:carboxymuconolactone decarboxylase family protein [Pseudovibrio sp. M1P-2-3]